MTAVLGWVFVISFMLVFVGIGKFIEGVGEAYKAKQANPDGKAIVKKPIKFKKPPQARPKVQVPKSQEVLDYEEQLQNYGNGWDDFLPG